MTGTLNTEFTIGLDSGGTQSRFAVADSAGEILFRGKAGSVKPFLSDSMLNDRFQQIYNLIPKTLISGITIVNAGVSGCGTEPNRKRILNFLNATFPNCENKITSDAEATLRVSFKESNGILLIAGTGSSLSFFDQNEKLCFRGGFGTHVGDTLSGYEIGRQILSIVLRLFERNLENDLTNAVFSEMNIHDKERESVSKVINSESFSPSQLAPVVLKFASEDESTCNQIVRNQLQTMVYDVFSIFEQHDHLDTVQFHGGLFQNEWFKDLVEESIRRSVPAVRIKTDPTDVAGLLARKGFTN